MKTLYLLRHAKSSWRDPELKDYERPLSRRGLLDVPVMAARFRERASALGYIITSPAIRAKTTAKLLAENINYPVSNIISNPELYFAGSGMLLKAAANIDENCEAAMLVGHNPALTDFVNDMAKADIDNVPTCGIVGLSLPQDTWADIELGTATLDFFDFPKKTTGADEES